MFVFLVLANTSPLSLIHFGDALRGEVCVERGAVSLTITSYS